MHIYKHVQSENARFEVYEGSNCTKSIVAYLAPPAHGRTLEGNIVNEQARSVLAVGPLLVSHEFLFFLCRLPWESHDFSSFTQAGDRLIVASDPRGNPTDSVSFVTVETDLAEGQSICVNTFESDALHESRVRVSKSWNGDGIDGKVSWFQVYRPSVPTYTTKVTNAPKWDNAFSEEGAGLSYDTPKPIIGLYCSPDYCESKRYVLCPRRFHI